MHTEEDLLPLSALQHLMFCERQCALIHVEQQWVENFFTAQGRIMHSRAHDETRDHIGDMLIERGVPLKSLRLGLIGKSDVIEFHPGRDGGQIPYPVEYKRGRAKPDDCDRVQLCAQAMCLEESLAVDVPEGAIFYGKTRRRETVIFDRALRDKTVEAAGRLHQLVADGRTPAAVYSEKCDNCSLIEVCLPRACSAASSAESYMKKMRSADEETS